jgi:hypothetical protein
MVFHTELLFGLLLGYQANINKKQLTIRLWCLLLLYLPIFVDLFQSLWLLNRHTPGNCRNTLEVNISPDENKAVRPPPPAIMRSPVILLPLYFIRNLTISDRWCGKKLLTSCLNDYFRGE